MCPGISASISGKTERSEKQIAVGSRLLYNRPVSKRLDPDHIAEDHPFEIDSQAAHLFKHPHLGIDDVLDVWASNPLFYPARPPAHWLMVAEVDERVLAVPIAPSRDGDPTRCRPIGCYEASVALARLYRGERNDI